MPIELHDIYDCVEVAHNMTTVEVVKTMIAPLNPRFFPCTHSAQPVTKGKPHHTRKTYLFSPSLNGKRERASPRSNLLLHLVDLGDFATGNLGLEVLELVVALGECALHFLADLDALVDVAGYALEVIFAETAAGHGGRADTDTAGGKSGLVAGDGVLVAGDVDLFQDSLDTCAI
jgi:hypothetical protein